MATNHATVNPPVPVTILILRVLKGLHVVYITCHVVRIKKHLHNRIKIIEIKRQ